MSAPNQIKALTLKSITLQMRQWKTNLCQVFLPIICLLFIFILDKIVTRMIKKGLDDFKPFHLVPPNDTNIDGIMYVLKQYYSELQKPNSNRSFPLNLDYEPPEFIYVSYDPNNVSASELGYINMDGSRAGFLGKMFNISGLLTVDVDRGWVKPKSWDSKSSSRSIKEVQTIHVPYFKIASSDQEINSILYDFASNGTQQNAAGALKFKQLHLNPSSPRISYVVQSDERAATKFCETIFDYVGRIDCWKILGASMATSVHDNALQTMTDGQFGIMGTTAQIPYLAQPPKVFSMATALGVFFFPMVLSLMLPVFTYTIVLEKEYKMREMMKLMGMKMSYYWIITYIFQYFMYILGAIVFVILCGIFRFKIISATSPVIWILMLIGWGFNLVSFGMLLAAILNSTLIAVVAGYMVVLLGPLFATILVSMNIVRPHNWPWKLILLVYPFPLVEVIFSSTKLCMNDDQCHTPSRDLVDMDIGMAIIAMFVDSVLYMLVALYLDKVLPQTWGVAAKPWFPIEWIWKNRFTRELMSGRNQTPVDPMVSNESTTVVSIDGSDEIDQEVAKMEKEVENGTWTIENSGVYIKHLRKEYEGNPIINWFRSKMGKKAAAKAAVERLSLAIGKSECFGLLGMNGAGKSTTMNILSGIIYKTRGTAAINGRNIDTHMPQIRKEFGLCPQFDVLYDELTCEEHLKFYARIKGVEKVQEDVDYLLQKVKLVDKKKTLAKSLSGGMRRRLSIAISLVGNPTTVMLDEPTTGLDPSTKRHLWDLILEAKKDKTVILTTHSMEEADVLCDRIGIMTRGKMNSMGSSMSLKSRYGKGYRVSISFDPKNREVADNYFRSVIPQAQLHTEFVGNLIYEIDRQYIKVSALFKRMELEKQRYGIGEWSINLCSLEDVFLTIVRVDEAKGGDVTPKSRCLIM